MYYTQPDNGGVMHEDTETKSKVERYTTRSMVLWKSIARLGSLTVFDAA